MRAALDLARHKYDLEVILIDKNGFHSYPADYYKLLAPTAERQVHLNPARFRTLFSSVTIPLAEIFEGRENVELVFEEAADIKPARREVLTLQGSHTKYDWLILAIGSVTNFYDIPGLKARALEFKTTADALNVRNAIDEVFGRKGKHEKINIVVGGGGFTGCEVAAELAGYLTELSEIHGHPQQNIKLSIVEAAPQILSAAGVWIQKEAEKRLKSLGVEILLDSPIVDVRDGNLLLKNEKTIDHDVLIWTAGVKANPLAEKMKGAILGKGSCVVVNEYLQVGLSPNIFCIGDASFCRGFSASGGSASGGDDKPLPMTAQTAISQGRYAAYAIKRALHGRRALPYYPAKSRFVIPLGGHYALADLGWFRVEGILAWSLKRLAALKYFLSILNFKKALKLWLKGARF